MHFMKIPKGMAKRQSIRLANCSLIHLYITIIFSISNNKNMIVQDKVLTMTTTTTTTQIFINLDNLKDFYTAHILYTFQNSVPKQIYSGLKTSCTSWQEYLCSYKCDNHAHYCLTWMDQWGNQELLEWSSQQLI